MKVFQIRQNFKSGPILAGAGYQPDLQKRRILARARAELRYSPSVFDEVWTVHSFFPKPRYRSIGIWTLCN